MHNDQVSIIIFCGISSPYIKEEFYHAAQRPFTYFAFELFEKLSFIIKIFVKVLIILVPFVFQEQFR